MRALRLTLQSETYNRVLAQHDGDATAAGKAPETKRLVAQIQHDLKDLAAVPPAIAKGPAEVAPIAAQITKALKTYQANLTVILKLPPTDPRVLEAGKVLPQAIATIDRQSLAYATKTDAYAKKLNGAIDGAYDSGRRWILITLALAALLGLAAAVLISEHVERGVGAIRRQLRSLREQDTASLRQGLCAIAAGDLTHTASATTLARRRAQAGPAGAAGHSQPRLRNQYTIPLSTQTISPMMAQKAWIERSPGTPTFMPQIVPISVSGSMITLNAVSTRRMSFRRCDRTDSFVASRPSTTSLKFSSMSQIRSDASLMSSK